MPKKKPTYEELVEKVKVLKKIPENKGYRRWAMGKAPYRLSPIAYSP
jgi:hypothetical protein